MRTRMIRTIESLYLGKYTSSVELERLTKSYGDIKQNGSGDTTR